jgi:hypothetical protein
LAANEALGWARQGKDKPHDDFPPSILS